MHEDRTVWILATQQDTSEDLLWSADAKFPYAIGTVFCVEKETFSEEEKRSQKGKVEVRDKGELWCVWMHAKLRGWVEQQKEKVKRVEVGGKGDEQE